MLEFASRSDSLYIWSPAHRPVQTQWLSPGSVCLVLGLAGAEPPQISVWWFWAGGHLASHLIVSFLGIHCYVTWNTGGNAYPLGEFSCPRQGFWSSGILPALLEQVPHSWISSVSLELGSDTLGPLNFHMPLSVPGGLVHVCVTLWKT